MDDQPNQVVRGQHAVFHGHARQPAQRRTWVFTQPQFLLLNVAVGGNWPGYPDATTVFPQQMLVDYVRVYTYVATRSERADGS